MKLNYTPEQQRAIETRGRALLVSAGAGSGKTRVLTQRLIGYICDPVQPRDIDSFLIITFTRAAAAELRSRISAELASLAAQSPLDTRLRRQQNLCCRAQIGTIHSFCGDLLRQNCHLAGIAPGFKVIEDERASAIKGSVLDKLIESRYEKGGEDFLRLSDTVGAGRDDRRLYETVLSLFDKLCSHPYPEVWAGEQARSFLMEGIGDVSQSIWGKELLESLHSSADFWHRQLEDSCLLISQAGEKIAKAYLPSFEASCAALGAFSEALERSWDEARELLPIPFDRLGSLRGCEDPETAELVKATRDACKKACAGFSEAMSQSSEELISDTRSCAGPMAALLELTMDFSRAYAAEKRRQNCLDFSDLEHMALNILTDPATGSPSALAQSLSLRYTEIMVDEYQDVNAVQDAIFRAVSRGGKNLFMVGDVKQSIYRFRMADPGIFMSKYRSFSRDGGESGQRILLRENFRSRRCVLDAANLVFRNIMSERLGEINYDDSAELIFGAESYPSEDDVPVKLCLLSRDGDDDEQDKIKPEVEFAAASIRRMLDEKTPVFENGVSRPCRCSDFAILLRSPSGSAQAFYEALSALGVPCQSGQSGGYFESFEISLVMDLLSVIDNPHDDVALVSVLRSPLFGFSADELAAIRAGNRDADFFEALSLSAGSCEKSAAFLRRLELLRTLSPDLSIEELLWRLFSELDIPALCSAMPGGEGRRQNLMQLFEYAGRFDSSGMYGLYRFIGWLRRLAQRGDDVPSVSGGDCVRIMSIHKSKGLEFPFVFLCGLSKLFNRKDSVAPVLLHEELGLGPKCIDLENGIEYPSLPRRAIQRRIAAQSLSEEMRILYVAMTRARERLIMTCMWKDPQQELQKLRAQLSSPLESEILRSRACPGHWIAAAALLDESVINIEFPGCPAETPDSGPLSSSVAPAPSPQLAELVKKRLSFIYPWAAAADIPSKLTATGRQSPEDESGELLPPDFSADFPMPELGGEETLTPAQRGSAAHAFLQFARPAGMQSMEGIEAELRRLVSLGRLDPRQAQSVDRRAVLRFGLSPLCRRMMAAQELRREFRFTLLVRAGDYFPGGGDDRVLMQGVIDCLMLEDGELTIIDYKTDNIGPEELAARAEHYRPQLEVYAEAARRICSAPVKQCILYFLKPGKEYLL